MRRSPSNPKRYNCPCCGQFTYGPLGASREDDSDYFVVTYCPKKGLFYEWNITKRRFVDILKKK